MCAHVGEEGRRETERGGERGRCAHCAHVSALIMGKIYTNFCLSFPFQFPQANSLFLQSHTDYFGGTISTTKKTETCYGRWQHQPHALEPLHIQVSIYLHKVEHEPFVSGAASSNPRRCNLVVEASFFPFRLFFALDDMTHTAGAVCATVRVHQIENQKTENFLYFFSRSRFFFHITIRVCARA